MQTPAPPGRLEFLLSRDGLIVWVALTLIVALSALYTVFGIGMQMSALEMTRMARPIGNPMEMGGAPTWTLTHAILVFLMWWLMMIAMMTPSAVPALLLFGALKRLENKDSGTPVEVLAFLSGYLVAWGAFSIAATALQWILGHEGLLSESMMTVSSPVFAGLLLIGAGLYQFLPLKQACLRHCQSPAKFLVAHWQAGLAGAFRIGLRHGTFCLGCCWALMVLLFVGGIMNLLWIGGIALFVAAEKLLPPHIPFARAAGGVMLVIGAWLILWA